MNNDVLKWLYIVGIISFVYWFTIIGSKFTHINPLIISVLAMIIVYYASNKQSVVLLI